MAILKQAGDGHLYIHGPYRGSMQISVWQVSREAELRLHREGVDVGTRVPNKLLGELIEDKLIFTGAKGHNHLDQEVLPLIEVDEPTFGGDPASLPLAIRTEQDRLELVLLLPPIPSKLVASLETSAFASTLSSFGLQISGDDLSAVALMPHLGGAQAPVSPSEARYSVSTFGRWPKSWDIKPWTMGARGLDPGGTLFTSLGDGGVRLRASAPVYLGSTYLCLTREPLTVQSALTTTGSNSKLATLVATIENWQLLSLQLPEYPQPQVTEWCQQRGHRLVSAPWSLSVVAPVPKRLLVDGTPVFAAGDELVISAESKRPHLVLTSTNINVKNQNGEIQTLDLVKEAHSVSYCSFRLTSIEHFCVRICDNTGPRATTRLLVDALSEDDRRARELLPSPLAIIFRTAERIVLTYSSIESTELRVLPLELLDDINIEVQVVLPQGAHLDVFWSSGDQRAKHTALGAVEAAAVLGMGVARALKRLRRTDFVIDAGAFGILSFTAMPKPTSRLTVSTHYELSTTPIQFWLAAVGPALAHRNRSRQGHLCKFKPRQLTLRHSNRKWETVTLSLQARAKLFHGNSSEGP